LSPEEVTQQLQLTKLKDKLWYVAPSVATDGTGIFEGLVSYIHAPFVPIVSNFHFFRHGSQTMSRPNPRNKMLVVISRGAPGAASLYNISHFLFMSVFDDKTT
jgi:hypothetical protein